MPPWRSDWKFLDSSAGMMRFKFTILLYVLARHPVVILAGNCISCSNPTIDSFGDYGLEMGNAVGGQAPSLAPLMRPRRDREVFVYCGGPENAQVKEALDAAIRSVSNLERGYIGRVPQDERLRNFAKLRSLFPTDNPFSLRESLSYLGLFLEMQRIRTEKGESLPLLIVCANPAMQAQYGFASRYSNVCAEDRTIVAYHPPGSATLMLCPCFFNLPTYVTRSFCPSWNPVTGTFSPSYRASTVEYQHYTLIRGYLNAKFHKSESIVIAPSPNVPNWNTLMGESLRVKLRSWPFLQFFVACKCFCYLGVSRETVADVFQCSNRDVSSQSHPAARTPLRLAEQQDSRKKRLEPLA